MLPVEVEEFMRIYESVGSLLKSAGNPALRRLAESWDISLPQLRERLASSLTKAEERAVVRGLKQGLRDLPKLIKSIEKCGFSELISKIEREAGISFSDI
jgi:hypothetical protein